MFLTVLTYLLSLPLGTMLIGGFLILVSVVGGVARNNRRFALWLTDLLIQYRWLIVIPVVLPLSALFDIYWYFRYLLVVRMRSAPLKHGERVADIQAQIKAWRDNGSEGLLCTARPTWLCMSPRLSTYKKNCNQVGGSCVVVVFLSLMSAFFLDLTSSLRPSVCLFVNNKKRSKSNCKTSWKWTPRTRL
jgi:hypothetical protein